jgi:hypothetical protein
MFYGCNVLENVEIPKTVTKIGKGAFRYCRSLVSITIPEGVSIIAERIFEYCDSLSSVEIPSTVIEIETLAFKECCNLSVIIYNSDEDSWKSIIKGFWWDYKITSYIVKFNNGSTIQ